VLLYPTDTVYGIGGDATSEEVIRKVHKIKGHGPNRPLSVMVADFDMIAYYCDAGLWEDIIIGKYLPGPYTFLLRKKREIPVSKTEKLGIRMPDMNFCHSLCWKFGKPIITTSANITDQRAPTKFGEIDHHIIDSVDLAIDGGETRYACHSMIIDLVNRAIIREGGEAVELFKFPQL